LLGVYQLSERWGAISEGGKMSELRDSETGKELTSGQKIADAILGANKHKTASPIGETVLTDEEIDAIKISDYPVIGKHSLERAIEKEVIAYTRSELIKQGWKSPEDVERILRGWQDKALQEVNLVRGTVKTNTRREVAKVIKARLGDEGMFFIREPQLQDWFEAFIKELEEK
jgi:hypothetical protein